MQPQCFCCVKLADAVNVGGRVRARERHPQQIVQRPGREVAVVHQHDQRKRIKRVPGRESLAQNRCTSPAHRPRQRGIGAAPQSPTTPGKQIRGSLKPSGKCRSPATCVGSVRRGGPAAAITTLEPSFSPVPE